MLLCWILLQSSFYGDGSKEENDDVDENLDLQDAI